MRCDTWKIKDDARVFSPGIWEEGVGHFMTRGTRAEKQVWDGRIGTSFWDMSPQRSLLGRCGADGDLNVKFMVKVHRRKLGVLGIKPFRVGEISWEVGVSREEGRDGALEHDSGTAELASCSLPPSLRVSSNVAEVRGSLGHPTRTTAPRPSTPRLLLHGSYDRLPTPWVCLLTSRPASPART